MKTIFKKINCEELNKLEAMIKDEGLSYTREDYSRTFPGGLGVYDVHQVIGFDEDLKPLWDVVCSTGTRGSEHGLLEFWGNPDSEPIGDLEAENALELIHEMAGI